MFEMPQIEPEQNESERHVGEGEPKQEAEEGLKEIAQEMVGVEEELRTARLSRNEVEAARLTEKQTELLGKRNEILQHIARNREAKLAA